MSGNGRRHLFRRASIFLFVLLGHGAASGQGLEVAGRVIVVPSAAERERIRGDLPAGAVALVRTELEAAGIRMPADSWVGPVGRVDGAPPQWEVDVDGPAFLVFDPQGSEWQVRLDDRFEIVQLSTQDARSALLAPPGRHVITLQEIRRLRNVLGWWGGVAGTPLIAAALTGLLHAVLARRSLRRHGARPRPPLRRIASLLALAALPWLWTLRLPLLENDYSTAILARQQIEGEAIAMLGDLELPEEVRRSLPVPYFRIVHHTIYGLETLALGTSGLMLHLVGILAHLACVGAVYLLLHRWFGAGAWAAALLGGVWPAAAQALTWNAAQALPMSHAFGLGAVLLALRYLDRGGAPSAAGVAALSVLSAATKETGLAYFPLLGVVALLAGPLRERWRRRLVLWGAVLAGGAGYLLCRQVLGYVSSGQALDRSFGALATLLQRIADGLPLVLAGGLAPTNLDPEVAPFTWLLALGLLFVALAARSSRDLGRLAAGLVLILIAVLPDASVVTSWTSPLLAREFYIVSLGLWGLLAAAALRTLARRPRPWGHVASAIILALILFSPFGHVREAELRGPMAEVAEQWVLGTARELEAIEADVLTAARNGSHELSGPLGFVVLGHPDRPDIGFSPIVGPTMEEYLQPPFTRRRWHGAQRATAAGIEATSFVRSYPWEIIVLASPHFLERPRPRHRLPPLAGLRNTTALAFATSAAGGSLVLEGSTAPFPLREIAALALVPERALPEGTVLALEVAGDATSTVLRRTRLEDSLPERAPIVIPLLDLAEIALAEGFPRLRVRVTAPDGRSVGAKPEARRDLPVIEVADTTQERVVARERPLPPFELDGVPRAGHLVFSLGEGLAELSPEPVVEFRARIPEKAVADPRRLSIDVLAAAGVPPEAWAAGIDSLRAAHPGERELWLWLEIRAVIGDPPWVQARSRPVPIRARLLP